MVISAHSHTISRLRNGNFSAFWLKLTDSHVWETTIFQYFGSISHYFTPEKSSFFRVSAHSCTISCLRNDLFSAFGLNFIQSHTWKSGLFKRLRSFSHCLTIEKLLVIAHFHTFSPLRNDHISAFGLNRTQNHTWKSDPSKRFGPFSHYLILVNNFF